MSLEQLVTKYIPSRNFRRQRGMIIGGGGIFESARTMEGRLGDSIVGLPTSDDSTAQQA